FPSSRCFIHAPASPAIYTLSLHDALPICRARPAQANNAAQCPSRRRSRSRRVRKAVPCAPPCLSTCAGLTRASIQRIDPCRIDRSEEHTSELQSRSDLVCRLLLEKKKKNN